MLITYELPPHLKLLIDNFYRSFLLEAGYDTWNAVNNFQSYGCAFLQIALKSFNLVISQEQYY